MPIKQSHYEILLSEYSNREAAIALLKKHRPYLEMIPSLRRPEDSIVTLPLPVARIRQTKSVNNIKNTFNEVPIIEASQIPCDIAILMCDPEWKIKMGAEIMVFIHRPEEDFSHLLSRWRHTQVALDKDYEWIMPIQEQHMLSEGGDKVYPLFIVLAETPDRIKRGLEGAHLPFILHDLHLPTKEEPLEVMMNE
jgi:hypothetical protein